MKTVTTFEVLVDCLDAYYGRSTGETCVSMGIATEEEANKIAKQWDHCDMVHGAARVVPVTKEVPDRPRVTSREFHDAHTKMICEMVKEMVYCMRQYNAFLIACDANKASEYKIRFETIRKLLCANDYAHVVTAWVTKDNNGKYITVIESIKFENILFDYADGYMKDKFSKLFCKNGRPLGFNPNALEITVWNVQH